MLVDSIGLSVSLLPRSMLWGNWVGLAVLLARGQLLRYCRRRVARPLLVMDAVRWGVAHHPLLLQGLTVVRRSLVLLRLPNHLRLEVVHLCLVLLLRLRLMVSLQHQLLLVLLPLLHCRDRKRGNLPKMEWGNTR